MTRKKSAGIYDRWLHTLGGGEQVAFAYAEALRDLGYETTMITHQEVDQSKAEQKMGIDLKKIKFRYLPESSSTELSSVSEEYDLFVNTSHLDYFPNRSQFGILSTFFPSQIYLTPFELIKRALLVPSFRRLFIYPMRYEGFRHDQYIEGKIYKWLGEKSSIVFKENVSEFKIKLYFETIAFSLLDQIEFEVNQQKIEPESKRLDDRKNTVEYVFKLPLQENRFTIHLPDHDLSQEVALIQLTIPSWRFGLYNLFKSIFPRWEMRLHGGPGVTQRDDLASYQLILTISDFCKKWIKEYWLLNSLVLYPPVKLGLFKPNKKKKNMILGVGRFFVTGHSKKQLQMVKQFKKLMAEKGVHGWELHLVGSVADGPAHQAYFQQVLNEAQGFPVFIHQDISFEQLKELYAQAKIYWHATGLDEDISRNPIRFEHFGITTVEAMASGAVPVVINAAGQKEIVTNESGFRWNNRKEWLSQTYELISNEKLRNKMSQMAIERSRHFGEDKFKARFGKLLEEYDKN